MAGIKNVARGRSNRWISLILLILVTFPGSLSACIWDSDTLGSEQRKKPGLAELILGQPKPPESPAKLQAKVQALLQSPRPTDTNWINEVAGTYLRLGQPAKAVDLLLPAAEAYPDDYGIHANLGTAYHLLGRYVEAEDHIRRDLEINPQAHFGLERYHLALLQYLIRDQDYQAKHVYVDELTQDFHYGDGAIAEAEFDLEPEFGPDLHDDSPPAYRAKWNLANDPQLEAGVSYMASLNPQEPACMAMLGMVCLKNRDLNLAAAAFERAIRLDSPQKALLEKKVQTIRKHIQEAKANNWYNRVPWRMILLVVLAGLFILLGLALFRSRRAGQSTH